MFDFSTFFAQYGNLFLQGTIDTLVMTCVATILAYVIGIPLGILLVVTSPNGLRPNRIVSTIVGWIVNIGRSVPFIILLVALIPFTRFIVGTSLGVPGAVVPLVVTAAPFAARMVEQSLEETGETEDRVTLSTMHSAKGLEYPVVFVVDANEGIVPHHKAGLSADIEEERRLFYVALTRAKDRLHVAAVRERYHRKTDVSRFIGEAGL